MKKSILFVLFALISVAGFSQITGWNAKVGMIPGHCNLLCF